MKIKDFPIYPQKQIREEIPDGIIVTMPVKFLYDLGISYISREYYPDYVNRYSKKKLIAYGFRDYLIQMDKVCNNPDSCWLHKISTVPTIDVLYCYITVLNRIMYRANIGGFEPGGKRTFEDGRDCEAKHWLVLTHPFIKAPEKIIRKGFQGFRYTEKLF